MNQLYSLQMHYVWKPLLYFWDQRVGELRKAGTGTQKRPYNTAQCYWKCSIFLIIFLLTTKIRFWLACYTKRHFIKWEKIIEFSETNTEIPPNWQHKSQKKKKSMFLHNTSQSLQQYGEKHQENFCCKFLSYKKFLHLGHWPSKQESTDVKNHEVIIKWRTMAYYKKK